jgi:hypothetical protein
MTKQWLTFNEAVEIVKARLGSSVGRAESVTNAARASGEVRFYDPAFPVLLIADDGLVGMDLRPGAQRKAGISADGKQIVHETLASQSACQISSDDLLDWLNRQFPVAEPKARRGGRPPAYDWEAIRKATLELMDENGDFSTDDPAWNAQARLEEALNDRFGVEKSALRVRLPSFLNDWRKLKAGN